MQWRTVESMGDPHTYTVPPPPTRSFLTYNEACLSKLWEDLANRVRPRS